MTLAPLADDGAHEPEQPVDVALGQKRRRLVQHQKAAARSAFLVHLRHRADDGEQRALDGRDVGDARVRIEIDVVARQTAASRRAAPQPS